MARTATRELAITKAFSVPLDAVTQTFGFIGRKGSGKTYAAGVLVESMLKAQAQVIVLDPVGNWYGLRLDASGKKKSSFDIAILGGEHGDLPLDPTSGRVVADFCVRTGSSVILDVSSFRKAERKRFVTDFAEELFHKKKSSRTPLHFVLEEAQVFAPEQGKGSEAMLGAIEDIVRLGRNLGIGCSMISQRPQSVNKEILNQAEPLVVFQLVAHHEREAVRKWMQHIGTDNREMLDALPALKTGQCFFWSPAWLGFFKKTMFIKKETYDASATPKVGAKQVKSRKLDPVDLTVLQGSMSEAIEQAKANDPTALKIHIQELKRKIAAMPTDSVDRKMLDGALKDAVACAIEARDKEWAEKLDIASSRLDRLQTFINRVSGECADVVFENHIEPLPPFALKVDAKFVRQPKRTGALTPPELKPRPQNGLVGGGALRMIQALADRAPARFTEAQWATMSQLKKSGGTWGTYKSRLKKQGLVECRGDLWEATELGVSCYGDPTRKPQSPEDAIEGWKKILGGGAGKMIDALVSAGASGMNRVELGEAVDLSPIGGTFGTYLSRLRTNGLVDNSQDGLFRITDILTNC